MRPEEIKTVIVTLGLLAESEGILAQLYREAGTATGDAAFWSTLARQEDKHSASLKEMARMITAANGAGFEVARRFPAGAVHSFMQYVVNNLAQVRNGSKRGIELYQLARSIEQAVLDQRYPDIVRTDDPAFNGLMEEIINETRQHLSSAEEKVKKLQAQP
jgi:hypothetical protein